MSILLSGGDREKAMNVGADPGLKEPRTGPAGRGLSLEEGET